MQPTPNPSPTRGIPRVGALATVRNRRGVIAAVEPHQSDAEGLLHLVSVEYVDPDGPPEDLLVWEREPAYQVLEPTALPDVVQSQPMVPAHLDALVRATRWTALQPFVDPDGSGPLERLPLAAPFYGAIQVEDFQLVPLLKALRMPRVSLMLADDVGLGKTIEAGLIVAELIQRRRIRRVLVVCPASLRTQWKREMWDKFSLTFDIVDRRSTEALHKRVGMDANPWRSHPRIVTSFDYLKQPDVLEQFRSAFPSDGTANLPWDLLIVDEVHNLAPAAIGEDSEVSRLLQLLSPWFEHKLFLSATPHNGHTRCFTGLLECLDPVRFSRESVLTARARERAEEVVIRRLKREVNERSNPPRFAERMLEPVALQLGGPERALSAAFSDFRAKVRSLVGRGSKHERLAGTFAVEVLGKRLLSCPATFAESWWRYRAGMTGDEAAEVSEVRAAEQSSREGISDDLEIESRARHAAQTVGAWLKPLADQLTNEVQVMEGALQALGLDGPSGNGVPRVPQADARYAALDGLIKRRLLNGSGFRADERLVVFTEYKTTLDYLNHRLSAQFPGDGVVRVLCGGGDMSDQERDDLIASFNDPTDPVRILVATDAAAEGLNLQESARYLLHFDVPWNPARLEQRNGRLDRHGQARDVVVHHFVTDDDADLDFLAYVVGKVHRIREDLGSTGEVFDAALERRLILGEDPSLVKSDLNRQIDAARGRVEVPRKADIETGEEELARLRALAAEVDLDAESLCTTLNLAIGQGGQALEGPDARGRYRLGHQIPDHWTALVNDCLRLPDRAGRRGALPYLLFDPSRLVTLVGGRPVFKPERDTALLHLGHPMFHQALASFARLRFPGPGGQSRWTVRAGPVPEGADALLLLTVEEMAVNELRETFHHWVRTLQLPIRDGKLEALLPHVPASELRVPSATPSAIEVRRAREVWDEIAPGLRGLLEARAAELTSQVKGALAAELETERDRESKRFQSRQAEVSELIQNTTLARLQREIDELKAEARQGTFFDSEERLADIERSVQEKEEEVRRRREHYEQLRVQLERERKRVLELLLPKRYALRGGAQVFPVSVEIRLSAGGSGR